MPIIERISKMQKLGVSNEEVIKRLQDEGVSPKEISEALDQSKVKSAIEETTEMQPSIMTAPASAYEFVPMPYNSQESQMQQYPQTTEMPMQEQMTTEQPTEEYAYPAYPQQQYQEYEYARADAGTMTEIAEQIVAEKLQKIEKQILEATAFKTETVGKMNNVDERLRRIEMLIDHLQTSIIGKIGEYGRNISDLKEEMLTTQESFSKILNPLTENIEELRKITKDERTKQTGERNGRTSQRGTGKKETKTLAGKKARKDNFERYLRG